MPGLLRGVARTAAIAGTATAVSNRVSRRQAGRWARQDAQQQQAYEQQAYEQQQAAAPPPPAAPAPPTMDDKIAQLKDLATLKEQGVITEEELATQKARILNS
ncbi:SHOCT domain-containing protein [Streptomyces sp. WAC06614]|uniref:SHOCT domain-containing protein n=1 Tax=Streptomyces sp. WAC06614 TaxID=2487416 RepID=UPI000F79C1CE|nr:SHOCT domain-containing protein [Streptomyces sp. WAC06614]RSS66708.1 SHOCT domain-containing protein [Streptomyces sp. WAC06614]